MKQIYNTAQKRTFRKWIKDLFLSWIRLQSCNHEQDFERVFERLQEIEDLIEIIARQVARWTKVKPGD